MFTHFELRRYFICDNELPLIFINACVITICLNLFKNAPAVAYNTARIISQAAHSILAISIIFDKIIFSPCSDIINFCLVICFYFNLKAKRLMRHCMTMCKQLPIFTFIIFLTSFQLQKQQQHKR
ncbi:hypothetical protein T12_9972 [Trichinella patagoniensis]|uniref:Uncharacterized protein n=1 Tax=Trichinella patagoniensis TaxID=990121 RepID=A0A0V0ZES7_9BILA|nr:hypothetical protein T12_9972 [Trichinella patagoniensis]